MRFLLGVLLLLLALPGCSPIEGESGFGSRLVSAGCVAEAAPRILGDDRGAAPAAHATPGAARVLRAATFNLHSGLGPAHAFSQPRATVERHLRGIAATIAASAEAVDVVGLNEVDFAARRSGGFDQAQFLARALEELTGRRYAVVGGETWRRTLPGLEARFGNAVLVRHRVRHAVACLYDDPKRCGEAPRGADLPAIRAAGFIDRMIREPRGVVKATIEFHGRPVDVIVTHLDAFALAEREAQAAHLLRRLVDPRATTVVLGDTNAVPTVMTYARTFFAADRTHDILTSGALADARVLYASRIGRSDFSRWATYPAAKPVWPLDAALGSLDLLPFDVKVLESRDSDHHGLYVAYRLTQEAAEIAAQRARHDAIRRRQLAQIVRCDLVRAGAAQWRWLLQGTQFLDVASAAERKALLGIASGL